MPDLSIYTYIFNGSPSSQVVDTKIWKLGRQTYDKEQSSGSGIGQEANNVLQ